MRPGPSDARHNTNNNYNRNINNSSALHRDKIKYQKKTKESKYTF